MLLSQLVKENNDLIRRISEQRFTLQALKRARNRCQQLAEELAGVRKDLSAKKDELEICKADVSFLVTLYCSLGKETAALQAENISLKKLTIIDTNITCASGPGIKGDGQS
ncbi:hypothetical protein F5Y19DRAFT_432288 [Xylariaceae sp. FL1651]|nr:hypothetical protein F5Y19DRAFT_432288 [Xylariaceae sp. FL1651]